MKKLWLLLAIAAPLQLIHSQEVKHASSVEQCRAEAAVWAKADNIVPPLTRAIRSVARDEPMHRR
jgi:hypothetical protein